MPTPGGTGGYTHRTYGGQGIRDGGIRAHEYCGLEIGLFPDQRDRPSTMLVHIPHIAG